MKLSVIICVYNTDKNYLSECLFSIRRSSVGGDCEILLVDDGSDIDYTDTVREFDVSYRRIENRGHLGARLYGISAAEGDYVAFVDSDDTVSLNYHRPMLDTAEKENADVVINGWAFHTERTRRACTEDSAMATKISAAGDESLLLFTSKQGREHSYFVLWNKLYRRSLLLKTKAHLEALGLANVRLTYSEDALMNFFIFRDAGKVTNVNSGFYFYRLHGAQSIAVTGKERLRNQIDSMSLSLGIMKKNIGNNKYANDIKRNIDEWGRLMARTHFGYAKAAKATELYGYVKEKYGVAKNRMPTYRDGAVYAKSELLGSNFDGIDKALAKIYFCGRDVTVSYERGSKCISRIIKDMPHETVYSKHGEFSVPKRKISFRDKIIHNPAVYKAGMLLFKKGSRVRAFLKKIF